MIKRIPAAIRYHADHGWLKTHLLFSFANYQDEKNMHFGTLRVFNDDYIDAHNGFSEHEHDNMEIVTIVLEGELTHKDSLGNKGVIKAGEVQQMSAGSGITHAEMNESDAPVHLYQIWLFPNKLSLPTLYGQKDFSNIEKNTLVAIASGEDKAGALPMQTMATIYKAELEAEATINYTLKENRGLFIYVSDGILKINDEVLNTGDQARIKDEKSVSIVTVGKAKLIIIDVPLIDGE